MQDAERAALIAEHEAAMASYRALVRQVALEAAREEDWCDEGLNAALRRLELEPAPERKEYTFAVRVTGLVEYTAAATTEEEALADVRRWLAEDRHRVTAFVRGARLHHGAVRVVSMEDTPQLLEVSGL